MKSRIRMTVAAILGCVVGSVVTAQLVQGQGQKPGPLAGKLSHISFAVADVEKTLEPEVRAKYKDWGNPNWITNAIDNFYNSSGR